MIRSLTLLVCLFFLSPAQAMENFDFQSLLKSDVASRNMVDWKVGEFQKRRIVGKVFTVGSVYTFVEKEEGDAIWVKSELDIISQDKQIHEILMDRKSGEILKYIVDGEEKEAPDLGQSEDCEMIEQKTETIRVPAGQFKSTLTVNRCPDDTYAFWVNDKDVNMGGQIKQAILADDEDPKKHQYKVELTEYGMM